MFFKQIVSILLVVSLVSTSNASNLFDGAVEKYGGGFGLGKEFDKTSIADKLKKKGTDYLGKNQDGLMKKALNKAIPWVAGYAGGFMQDVGGNALDYCYTYTPKKSGSFKFTFNPCDFFRGVNPCSFAPSMSTLGFSKKPMDVTKDFDMMAKFCKMAKVTVTEKHLKDNIKGYNTDTIMSQNIQKELLLKKDSKGDKKKGIKTLDEGRKALDSVLSMNNIAKHPTLNGVISKNDYKSSVVLKNLIKSSDTKDLQDDASKLHLEDFNIQDKTFKEYEESIDTLASQISSLDKSLDFNYIKKTAIFEFDSVNNETSDEGERETQKDAVKANLLKTLREALNLKEAMDMSRIDYKVDESKHVVYPTSDYVGKATSVQDRLRLAFLIDKQKIEKAEMIAKIKKESETIYNRAESLIEVAKINSRLFDREQAYAELMNELGIK